MFTDILRWVSDIPFLEDRFQFTKSNEFHGRINSLIYVDSENVKHISEVPHGVV